MAKFTKKISNLINQQAPEFVLSDHPKFLEFIKTYYKFMESAEIVVDNVELTDGIRLETETAQENNLVLNASRLDTDRTSLDAGSTLKANGLVVVENICKVSTRLAVNRSYMKTNLKTIQPWIEKVEEVINV